MRRPRRCQRPGCPASPARQPQPDAAIPDAGAPPPAGAPRVTLPAHKEDDINAVAVAGLLARAGNACVLMITWRHACQIAEPRRRAGDLMGAVTDLFGELPVMGAGGGRLPDPPGCGQNTGPTTLTKR